MKNITDLKLKKTVPSDLEKLFEFQTDKEGIYLAAFTPIDPTDKEAYINKYQNILQNPNINNQTIYVGNIIVGSIAKFILQGEVEITYWLDKKFWGKGIASAALHSFLQIETERPIYGRVAYDNFGSQKVLEKCGFTKVGEDRGFANARKQEIIEYVYKLS